MPSAAQRPFRLARRGLCESALRVLGLPRDATPAQIKKRYYELAKVTHPDVSMDANSTAGTVVADDAAAAGQFRRITDAYNRLVGGEAADTDRAAAQRESEGPAMRARWNIRRRPSAPAF